MGQDRPDPAEADQRAEHLRGDHRAGRGFFVEALSAPHNAWVVQHVETARQWGWSPTAILLQQVSDIPSYKKNPRKVHPLDYALALACKQIADERCSKCGTPAWWAYSTNQAIDFEIEDHTCHACAAVEQAEEDQKDRPKGTIKIPRVIPVSYDDGTTEELPTRMDFFAELTRQAEWKARVKADPSLLDPLQSLSNEVTETIE